jgi:xanthine dehydrogenase accessory factor
MDPLNLKKLNQERRSRRAALLLTDLTDGRDRVIRESDFVAGELGEAVAKAFRSGKSVTVSADGTDYFLNVHVPPPRVVAIGAVHISQALALIARISGYDIEIIDPRTAFATPERFEGTMLHAEWPEEVLKARPLDAYTAVAALTHDPKIDDYPIAEALRRNCFYVGALGSRKTHARRVERLEKLGIGNVQIERIHAPIGVDIAAASPQEIAVAVMAEIIGAFRKRGIGAEAGAAEAAAE